VSASLSQTANVLLGAAVPGGVASHDVSWADYGAVIAVGLVLVVPAIMLFVWLKRQLYPCATSVAAQGLEEEDLKHLKHLKGLPEDTLARMEDLLKKDRRKTFNLVEALSAPLFNGDGALLMESGSKSRPAYIMSASRMIAFVGALVMLLAFTGFILAFLWRYVTIGQLPDKDQFSDVSQMMLTGSTTFLPYIAGQVREAASGLKSKK